MKRTWFTEHPDPLLPRARRQVRELPQADLDTLHDRGVAGRNPLSDGVSPVGDAGDVPAQCPDGIAGKRS